MTIEHPSEFLDTGLTTMIREDASYAEQQGDITSRQLRAIIDNKWFRMFVPARMGGLGLSLPEVLRIEEGLAWADGSTAWIVTLCSGAGWFVGFLDQAIVGSIVRNNDFCIAGSGAATGTAEIVPQGFRINGTWRYASGSLHATMFTANCVIKGSNEVRSFILRPDEVNLQRTWNSMGMVATASHSFEVRNQVIPSNRGFVIDASHPVLGDPVYKYPFLQLAETTLAVNVSGMAMRFCELCQSSESRLILDHARQLLYDSVNGLPSQVSSASRSLVRISRDVVNKLYPSQGLRAADKGTEINRVWRNFHTAAQHSIFANNT